MIHSSSVIDKNAKLTNSTVSVTGDTGTHAVDLGDTLTVEGGTGITTTVTTDKVSIAFTYRFSTVNHLDHLL